MDKATLLTSVRAEFVQSFAEGLDLLLPHVTELLLDASDVAVSAAEAQLLLDTRLSLVTHAPELKQTAINQLQRLLDRSFVTAYNRERRPFAAVIPGGSLSLLETTAVDKALSHEAYTSRFRNAAEAPLRDLNVRVALLFDKTDVLERENPFRPYLVSTSLLSAVNAMGLVEPQSSILAKAVIDSFVPHVIILYKHINMLLASQDIPAELPLRPRSRPAFAQPFPMHQAPRLAPPQQAFGTAERPSSDLLLRWVQMKTRPDLARNPPQARDDTIHGNIGFSNAQQSGSFLRGLFGGNSTRGVQDGEAFATYSGNTLLADSITRLEHNHGFDGDGMGEPTLHNRILENRAKLWALSQSPEEHTVVDVVAILFEFILRDGQVPEKVRGQLGRMQFQVLKLGLFDPALFAKANHPAREWLNRVGSVSLGLSIDDTSAMAINLKIQHMIDTLLNAPTCNAELFEGLLAEFEEFLATTAHNVDLKVDRAVRVLESAESRAVDYAQNTADMVEVLAGLELDPYLANFLTQTWALVLERIGREQPEKSMPYRQIVPRLIWSVAPKQSNDERTQMLKLLPELVQTLTLGLTQTRLDDTAQKAFLNWLVEAHVVALRETAAAPSASLQFLDAHFAAYSQGHIEHPACAPANVFDAEFVTEAAAELGATLELLDQQITTTAMPDNDLDSLSAPELDERYRASVIARLRSGIMIEFTLNGLSRRARLNWVSPRVASLLLTIEALGSPAAISVKLFRRLLVGGQVRFLENEPLFERAVAALLRTADEMESWLDTHEASPQAAQD